LLQAIADTLSIEEHIPEVGMEESEVSPEASLDGLLTEMLNHPTQFDSQLYMFEACGTLLSLIWRSPERQRNIFAGLIQPVLDDVKSQLEILRSFPVHSTRDATVTVSIIRLHHDIAALGQLAKGFPDLPSAIPEDYVLPPISVFQEIVEAMLATLNEVNRYKIIRDSVRVRLSSILSLISTSGSIFVREDDGTGWSFRHSVHSPIHDEIDTAI
jgi:exportin-T